MDDNTVFKKIGRRYVPIGQFLERRLNQKTNRQRPHLGGRGGGIKRRMIIIKKCKHCGATMDIYPSLSGGSAIWVCPNRCGLKIY